MPDALILTFTVVVAALIALLLVIAVVVFIQDVRRVWPSPEERMMRERRRHAERTAKAIRRMGQIRRDTIARMDDAERQW